MASPIVSSASSSSPTAATTIAAMRNNNTDSGTTAGKQSAATNNNNSNITEEKYKQLKRKLKAMMEVNETISKEYSQAKRKVRLLVMERNVLLDNIARMGKVEIETSSSDEYDDDFMDDYHDLLPMTTSTTSATAIDTVVQGEIYHPHDQHQRQLTADHRHHHRPYNSKPKPLSRQRSTSELAVHVQKPRRRRGRKQSKHPDIDEDEEGREGRRDDNQTNRLGNVSILNSTVTASAPPKRSKMSRAVTKTRRVQPVERDENGNVKLPQQIGVLTVVNLGKIIHDREAFHNERYIFPVGFTVERTYPSMVNPNSNTSIVSTILDGGDGPRFHIVAADQPDEPIIANSATGAWTVVVRRSNEIRHREHSNSASGPDYYGFKHPTIAKMIQDLPNADKLRSYVRQNFEEMEPRAAKGVMAAAQKKRGNLEQMGNANVRPTNSMATSSSTHTLASTSAVPPVSPDGATASMSNSIAATTTTKTATTLNAKPSSPSSSSRSTPLPSPPPHPSSLSFITAAVSHQRHQQYHEGEVEEDGNDAIDTEREEARPQRHHYISPINNSLRNKMLHATPYEQHHHHLSPHDNPHSISSLLQPASPSPFRMNKFEQIDDEVDQLHSDNDDL